MIVIAQKLSPCFARVHWASIPKTNRLILFREIGALSCNNSLTVNVRTVRIYTYINHYYLYH